MTDRQKPAERAAQGMRRAVPIVLGYLPVGFAFGVLADKTGLSAPETIFMSLAVFAGSAQLIAVGMLAAAASVTAATFSIVLTTFVVNLRHLLMSASLAPYMRRWSKKMQALFTFQLTDETFAMHAVHFHAQVAELTGGHKDCGGARQAAALRDYSPDKAETTGLNMTAQLGWVTGSALGALFGGLIGDVKPLGLDYALPAMFVALLVAQVRGRLHVIVAVTAGAVSVGLSLAGVGQWNVIIATVLAATLGTMIAGREPEAVQSAECLPEFDDEIANSEQQSVGKRDASDSAATPAGGRHEY
ncbi:AzlC family ABC transporter permease [Oleidesulfovibrio sp.]|uniref:AzlC family ABC transporter permease n=1 Tax=Oleidesulfovibrio sp. TaxID=2909707 RepID=UPI003A8BC1D1